MRPDMAKLICECYRLGAGKGATTYRYHRARLKHDLREAFREENYDVLSARESMRGWADRNWWAKELGENLSPLKNFLFSCIGRLWDDVHSEMSQHIRLDSTVQRHIWEHAEGYVEKNTFLDENGGVRYHSNYWWNSWRDKECPPRIENSFALVYVCPETGVLKKVPERPRYRHRFVPYAKIRIEIDRWTQAHKIKGNWYLVYLDSVPQTYWKPWTQKERDRILSEDKQTLLKNMQGRWIVPEFCDVAKNDIAEEWDAHLGTDWHAPDLSLQIYGRKDVYAKRRKQMNKREIRRYKVRDHERKLRAQIGSSI